MLPDQPTPKTERTCPKCGLVFASDKLGGLCPSCLLANTLDFDDTDEGPAFWEEAAPGPKTMPKRAFSHFEILDELGRGGMGVVYRARDLNTERILALKVLQAHHLEVPDLVQRFRSEVRAVSSLDHPHVLPIHEVGEHDGIPFFSMKLTTGGSLAHCIGNYLGKPREAARLLAKVARGVQHAHERGILHRDLKPGNILLDAAGEPYVCDFGLAKWLEDDRKLTVTAAVLGTPHYIAPEQAHGNKGLTTAVDIYSLGAILYELLTGRPPFVGGTVLETLVASQEKTPDRPSSIAKNVPRDLETICLKALQLEPSARYATAGAFADDLESYLAGRPIQARPVGAAEQLWRWARRNPLPATLVAALALLITAIAFGSTMAALRIDSARKRALIAEADKEVRLYQSLLAQARAYRLTGTAGQRFEALDAVRQAAVIRPSADLRTEAIAALSLCDARIGIRWQVRSNALKQPVRMNSDLTHAYIVVKGGVEVQAIPSHSEMIKLSSGNRQPVALAISDSGLVAGKCADGTLLVWRQDKGEPLIAVPGFSLVSRDARWPYDFAFSPDGTLLAAADSDSQVTLFATDNWMSRSKLPSRLRNPVLAFSPTAPLLAIASQFTAELNVWDTTNGRIAYTYNLPAVPQHIDWSPDGRSLAIGGRDYNAYIVDAATGETKSVYSGHGQDVTYVKFSPSDRLLATTSRDNTVRIWDTRLGEQQVLIPGLGGEPVLVFSRDGGRLGVTDYNNDAVILELAAKDRSMQGAAAPSRGDFATLVSSIDFSPSGRYLATASYGSVAVYESDPLRLMTVLYTNPGYEKSVRFWHTDNQILVASRSNPPTIYQLNRQAGQETLTALRTLEVGKGAILGTGSRYNTESVVFTDAEKGSVFVYDVASSRITKAATMHPNVWDAVVGHGWLALAYSGTGPDSVDILDLKNLTPLRRLPAGAAGTLCLTPDGGSLVTTGYAGGIVWDTHQWTQTLALQTTANKTDIQGVTCSNDGKYLAVSTVDRVLLLDARTGNVLTSLESRLLRSSRYRIAFSADDKYLAAQGADNSIQVWNLGYVRDQLIRLGLYWN